MSCKCTKVEAHGEKEPPELVYSPACPEHEPCPKTLDVAVNSAQGKVEVKCCLAADHGGRCV